MQVHFALYTRSSNFNPWIRTLMWCKDASCQTMYWVVMFWNAAVCSLISITRMSNRPFYRYGGHIELIRFKEHYGMPWGHQHYRLYLFSIYARFSGQFFFTFSQKKIVIGKKDRCAVFGCNHARLFPEKNTLKFSFCPKSARKYWASAPWESHNTP